jgi:hypothetical protein
LEAALYKFGFLTYAQIADFFAGELKGRSIRRCIAQLKKDRLIAVSRPDESDRNLCTHWSETYLGIDDYSVSKHYFQSPRELPHRIACNDVYISLAKCGFVSNVISEHEIKRFKIDCKTVDRNPDGVFTLSREGREPFDVAIEVETTHRNRNRINEVIQAYVDTYDKYPDGLRGVLIVAPKSNIVSAYQQSINQIGQKYPKRFILSERLDLSDVKETIFGRSFTPLSKHPKNQVLNWATSVPRKQLKTEHMSVRKNTGYIPMFRDKVSMAGVKK